ncbi:transcription elongation factor GreA [Paenibacillus sp. HJGM_3]|uniref:transcription elongation factor GreA n=1 Tax=Paenibacillus sp. HJGM_3 TaxID=3379816 RepID=UPI00385BCB45
MAQELMLLTPQGYAELEAELEDLKVVKRKELAERIKVAISYGDLKENSEYHSAKNDQAFMESRIKQIEHILKNARIQESQDASTVQLGSTVILNDIEFAERVEYRIVGAAEADVSQNKISYESPLGKALMGQSVGARIEVAAPAGTIEYELLEIKIG